MDGVFRVWLAGIGCSGIPGGKGVMDISCRRGRGNPFRCFGRMTSYVVLYRPGARRSFGEPLGEGSKKNLATDEHG